MGNMRTYLFLGLSIGAVYGQRSAGTKKGGVLSRCFLACGYAGRFQIHRNFEA
jgi:hypothetical protein